MILDFLDGFAPSDDLFDGIWGADLLTALTLVVGGQTVGGTEVLDVLEAVLLLD